MDIGIIAPSDTLDYFVSNYSRYHLVLAHMVERGGKYVDFYRSMSKRGDFITLDNSSFEVGDGVYTPSDLIRIAKEVGASEVMAPEKFPDSQECVRLVNEFIEEFKSDPRSEGLGIFATAHGDCFGNLRQCVRSYIENPYVNTIGLSCRMDFDDVTNDLKVTYNETLRKTMVRVNSVNKLHIDLIRTNKKVHLLGLNSPMEFLFYRFQKQSYLRSNDSSAAYINGKKRTFLDRLLYDKPKEKIDFNEKYSSLNAVSIDYILANIVLLQEIAK